MPTGSAALLIAFGLSRLLDDEPQVLPPVALAPVVSEEATDDSDLSTEVQAARLAAAGKRSPAVVTVADFDEAMEGIGETVVPPRRVWVRHRIRPRERLSQIAARYGTTVADLRADNHIDPNRELHPRYRRIRVRAARIPPPRRKVHTEVRADESWGDIAARLRVEELDLRAWNWESRKLPEGRVLVAWVDPMARGSLRPGQGPEPVEVEITAGGRSVGRPQRGRLEHGVLLPESTLYTRRHPTHGLWGSTHTLEQIQAAFGAFRHDSGFEGEVIIGAISRRRGGRFHPHISHRSGRDVDIRLPLLQGVPPTDNPNPDEIDWLATWSLVDAFVDTGEVDAIFLSVRLHRRLYEAARILGETPETLREVITWPSWRGKHPVVRHSKGHDVHIHVRFGCGPDEPRCRQR